jgi:hypothetical protein
VLMSPPRMDIVRVHHVKPTILDTGGTCAPCMPLARASERVRNP